MTLVPLRVHAILDHYSEPHRKALNDILKPLWNDASLEHRRATYGRRVDAFELASPEAADIHVLPMKWQYYVEHGRVDLALRAVELARKARKPIAVFSLGDFTANFPVPGADIHVFEASGYRSRRAQTNHGMPAFIDDPLASLGGRVELRDKGPRPIVGFCGQAGASLARHAARLVRNRVSQLEWRLGRRHWEPTPLEHTWFRQRVLDAFQRSPDVETRFILRTKYRAGVHTADRNDPKQLSRGQFIDNLRNTDYTLCVRGGGNFSIRFYEALAMGRIPAFVDTDCVLPFARTVDWRHYTAWSDSREDAPASVARFHSQLSPSEFRERQLECRRLWEDRLTPDGFYLHFREHFPEVEQ